MAYSPSRRSFLVGAGAAAACLAPAARLHPAELAPATAAEAPARQLILVAAEREGRLLGPEGPASRLWTFGDALFPVIRMRRGERLQALLENRLAEHTSVHWHGVRVPNAQDGVPYMTQPPVQPGGTFRYDFTVPDTGTFFFHPHCDTSVQLGRGLAGILVVEGDETKPYAADRVLALKDWRLAPDGAWLPFTSDAAAARAGTFGTVRTVNGEAAPRIDLPAGRDARLRLVNLDPTRIGQLGIEGAEAAIIAIDGNAVSPVPLDTWRLGPAMRLDLAVRAPAPGKAATLMDYFAAQPVPLATLVGAGTAPGKRAAFDPPGLRLSDLPVPDLDRAEPIDLRFASASGGLARVSADADPLSGALLDSFCTAETTHWSINKRSWASRDHANVPPPLAQLTVGRSYRMKLGNETPQSHPVHIHGMTFRVLSSNKRDLPDHYADTVLLTPNERIEIAVKPTEPGDWMVHCHLIEHQETGMMGFFRVLA